ncbi:MAG: M23 family metallopeptidase [Myxococcales bacterium]|nr:M23 family metallopeptidase [Myxococcales bacterium]
MSPLLVATALFGAPPAVAQAPTGSGLDPDAIVPGTSPGLMVPETDDIEWQWPLYGRVTSQFGFRRDPTGRGRRMHSGIDIAAAPGRTVRAAGKGVIRFAGRNAAYGLMVEIQHPDGHLTRYAHLNALWVQKGKSVEGGDPVGTVGSTGRSTGPHLHFELREGRKPVDPAVIAIHFGAPVDAAAKQKGDVLRVPGLPRSRMVRTVTAAMERLRGITAMFWDWWSS